MNETYLVEFTREEIEALHMALIAYPNSSSGISVPVREKCKNMRALLESTVKGLDQ